MHDSAYWRDLDSRYLWHPFTQMQAWNADEQVVVAGGEGNYLIDTDNNRYLDGVSSLWCNLFGHRHPVIDQHIREQLDAIAHSTQLGLASTTAAALAEKIVNAVPDGLDKVFYSDSGSTSVEIALKMAYQFCQQNDRKDRKRFIAISEAYHGDTIGSVSVGGIDLFHATFKDMLFDAAAIPTPYCYRCPFDKDKKKCSKECFQAADDLFKKEGSTACALITEPGMQGAAGMIKYPDGFLTHLRSLCDQYGVFMIVDEVAAGFGRTGTMFASEHEDVHPDIMCIAKGLTGGYLPVAATITTNELYDGFLGATSDMRTFYHGHTYTGNQLGCAAGLGTFAIFESQDVLGQVNARSQQLEGLLERVADHPRCGDIRRIGLMGGIELVKDRSSRESYTPCEGVGARVCLAARQHGVMIRPIGDVIILMPQLSITETELEKLIDTIYVSIDTIVKD